MEWIVRVAWVLLGSGVLYWIYQAITNFIEYKKYLDAKEINLEGQKIKLDIDSKPIDDVVADSNKSHGVKLE